MCHRSGNQVRYASIITAVVRHLLRFSSEYLSVAIREHIHQLASSSPRERLGFVCNQREGNVPQLHPGKSINRLVL